VDELPNVPDGYEFHHIGYATTSVDRERALFEFLGYRIEGEAFEDPAQGVAGCFLVGPGPRIELLESLSGAVTLTPWIDAGIKIYHFAYWVENIEAAIAWARTQRAKVTVNPVPAIAFGGRLISFVMFRNGLMLEFIQRTV
jgi:methylmalonyl-CoA/ethylmalonyl-CoA epimerase